MGRGFSHSLLWLGNSGAQAVLSPASVPDVCHSSPVGPALSLPSQLGPPCCSFLVAWVPGLREEQRDAAEIIVPHHVTFSKSLNVLSLVVFVFVFNL